MVIDCCREENIRKQMVIQWV